MMSLPARPQAHRISSQDVGREAGQNNISRKGAIFGCLLQQRHTFAHLGYGRRVPRAQAEDELLGRKKPAGRVEFVHTCFITVRSCAHLGHGFRVPGSLAWLAQGWAQCQKGRADSYTRASVATATPWQRCATMRPRTACTSSTTEPCSPGRAYCGTSFIWEVPQKCCTVVRYICRPIMVKQAEWI